MKKRKILIPEPKSKFLYVRCPDCGNEQIIFDHASMLVRCGVCNRILARPTGGTAKIEAHVLKVLG